MEIVKNEKGFSFNFKNNADVAEFVRMIDQTFIGFKESKENIMRLETLIGNILSELEKTLDEDGPCSFSLNDDDFLFFITHFFTATHDMQLVNFEMFALSDKFINNKGLGEEYDEFVDEIYSDPNHPFFKEIYTDNDDDFDDFIDEMDENTLIEVTPDGFKRKYL